MRAIGFLGGSFDPVHLGHVRLALAALESLPLEEVRFMPAAQSWQKGAPGATGAQRAAMLSLAVVPHARLSVDERELVRGGTSYTIDTARELRHEAGPGTALFLILGADQFLNLHTWREWEALFDLVHIAVAGRPGYMLDQSRWPANIVARCASRLAIPSRYAPAKAFGEVHLIDMAPQDVSATTLRAWLAQRAGTATQAAAASPAPPADAAALLPGTVLDYIERHHLYLEN